MKNKLTAYLTFILLGLVGTLLLDQGRGICDETKPPQSEEAIMAAVLDYLWAAPKYTVVVPQTSFCRLNMADTTQVEQAKKYLLKHLKIKGEDLSPLIAKLLEMNRRPLNLHLSSDPEKGYVIDYKGEYQSYFKEGGTGWEGWYKEHPNADGETDISRPVYDERTGIVLIYVGTQTHWKAGVGNVLVFKYSDGNLKELARVMTWIS